MAKAKKNPVGCPTLYGENLRNTSLRVTEKQLEKLKALGGGQWLRDQIDAAPTPRKKA